MSNQINLLLQQAIDNFAKGNLNQTIVLLSHILRMQPKNFHALHLMGICLGMENKHLEALSFLTKAVKINSSDSDANFNLAKALSETGNYVESIKYYKTTIKLNPKQPQAWLNFGKSLCHLHDHIEALSNYDRAIELKPDYAEAWFNKGITLHDLKRYEEALAHYDIAIELKPDYAEAWFNKGITLHDLKRYEEALAHYDTATRLKPDYVEAWSNQGVVLHDLTRYEEAISLYERAILLKPDCVDAWSNRGISLQMLKRYQEALSHHDHAIQLDPLHFDSYWNKSLIYLSLGDFHNGWELYNYRWKRSVSDKYRYSMISELKSIHAIANKSILVWHEQGYGDSIQFSRYVYELIKLGANVTFEVQKPLLDIFPSIKNMTLTCEPNINSEFDFQVPLLSLPNLFNNNIENIPSPSPIKISPEDILKWKNKLNLSNKKLNIGLAISGNPNHKNDVNRSMSLSDISPLLDYGQFFLIQNGINRINFHSSYESMGVYFLGDEIHSFVDTASILMNMDLIISVDTSLIHLAGSLNKEAYLMLPWCPEWRWLLDRSDTPWYSSVKIFRQESMGNWGSVTKKIKNELSKFKN